MKKFTSFVTFLALLSFNHKTNAQCATAPAVGQSANMLTIIRNATNPIAANKDLNTVIYAHRNSTVSFGGNNGNIRYDISTDGGTTWTNNLGVLNPNLSSYARYPNVTIYNPPANTNTSNAYLGYMAATVGTATSGWNGQVTGVRQLNNTGNTENYNQAAATTPLIAHSLVKGAPGIFWATDAIYNGTLVTGFQIYKGTWTGSDISWATNFTTTPSFNTAYDGTLHVSDYNIAFDPTGMKGWMSFLGHLNGGPTNYAYYPVFYKTLDGGNTWVGPIQVDINQFSCATSILTGTNVLSAGFEHDLTVDVNGNPHFFTTLCNGNNAYAVYFASTHRMFDITNLNGVWNAYDVANVNAGRGGWGTSPTNTVTMDMAPQISRTADGKKIFYTWVNNSTYTLGVANQAPNLFSRAFDVTLNKWTIVKDFTSCNGTMNGLILFPHLAAEVLEPAANIFKLASVYGVLTVANDPGTTSNFRFIDNATFISTDFTINQPTVAVSINQGSNWLLCPSNNLTLSIAGVYSQVLWNNATITNSTTVNTPSLYIVTVKNACAFGADSITVTGLVSTPIANSASICIGNTSTLSVTGNAFSYTWQPSNVTTTSTIISPTTTSIYTLNATGNGPCVDSKTLQVTVNPLPTITVNSPTTCTGSNLIFTATGGTVVNWVGPNSFFTSVQNPTIVNAQPIHSGCYTVTGASAFGCTNTAISCATVLPLPSLTVSGTPTVMCAGNSATFNVTGANTYSWNSGPTTSVIVVNPSVTTSYTVIGTDVNTCTSSAVSSLSVNPLPVISISGPSVICVGSVANITASGANTHTWNTTATTSSISVSPTVTTTYTATGTSSAGCVNSTTYTQNVSTCSGLAANNNVNENSVSIYPNPNNGEFMIVSGAKINLNIINGLGETVSKISLSAASEQKINLNDLPSGVYFIIGENQNGIVRQKILITK